MESALFRGHFEHPRNAGALPPPAITVEAGNPACGDILRLSVEWTNGVVTAARYLVRGCSASIAAGSALTVWLEGKNTPQLRTLTPAMIEEEVGGLIPESKHAAVLCVDAVRQLLKRM